jgi:hypothetical protein
VSIFSEQIYDLPLALGVVVDVPLRRLQIAMTGE